jgi:hypothetical protein
VICIEDLYEESKGFEQVHWNIFLVLISAYRGDKVRERFSPEAKKPATETAFAILLVVATCVISYAQQDESRRPSPAAQAQCKFSGGKTITVNYSSPRMRGRKVLTSINIRRSAHAGLSPACSGTGLATMQVVLRKTSKDQ